MTNRNGGGARGTNRKGGGARRTGGEGQMKARRGREFGWVPRDRMGEAEGGSKGRGGAGRVRKGPRRGARDGRLAAKAEAGEWSMRGRGWVSTRWREEGWGQRGGEGGCAGRPAQRWSKRGLLQGAAWRGPDGTGGNWRGRALHDWGCQAGAGCLALDFLPFHTFSPSCILKSSFDCCPWSVSLPPDYRCPRTGAPPPDRDTLHLPFSPAHTGLPHPPRTQSAPHLLERPLVALDFVVDCVALCPQQPQLLHTNTFKQGRKNGRNGQKRPNKHTSTAAGAPAHK
eukprot:353467-Chlamydomonas_euryale.AAC.2